ncbi:hypothetical protein Taro_037989 [Colocasia esculenta]|uniref:Uncharacterized protein n=1 Tax=Colocasia esculenta TaxID=4460 RepID=A0A843W251_COLES|nr:hypothetical protein [Colocasia esculenta]
MRAAVVDQAGNDRLEGDIRMKLLGFRVVAIRFTLEPSCDPLGSLIDYPEGIIDKVGYWPDQPVVCSRVVASFLSDSCFATRCVCRHNMRFVSTHVPGFVSWHR